MGIVDPSFVGLGVVGLGLAAVVGIVVGARTHWRHGVVVGARVLLVFAAAVVAMLTLVGYGHGMGDQRMLNLTPFASIRLEFHNLNHETGLWNNLGNVLLFAPIGFLGILGSCWPWWRIVTLSILASFGIETIQYFIGRSADIDDVILNTTGAIIGATLAVPIRHFALQRDGSTRRP